MSRAGSTWRAATSPARRAARRRRRSAVAARRSRPAATPASSGGAAAVADPQQPPGRAGSRRGAPDHGIAPASAFAAFAAFRFCLCLALLRAAFFDFLTVFFLTTFEVWALPAPVEGPAAAAVPARIATSESERTSVRSMDDPLGTSFQHGGTTSAHRDAYIDSPG